MVGTQSNPNRKLSKDHIESRVKGHIQKHKAKKLLAKHPPPNTPPANQESYDCNTEIEVNNVGPLANTPSITPIINITGRLPGKPITHRDTPTCLDFGKFCRILYPGGRFCSSCNWWEEELHHCPPTNSNKIKPRVGKKYACSCNHRSFVQPVQRCKESSDLPPLSALLNHRSTMMNTATQCPLPTQYKNKYDPSVLVLSSSDDISDILNSTLEIAADSNVNDSNDGNNIQDESLHNDNSSCVSCPETISPIVPRTLNHIECSVAVADDSLISTTTVEQHLEAAHNNKNTNNKNMEQSVDYPPEDTTANQQSTLGITPSSDSQSVLHLELVSLRSALKVANSHLVSSQKQVARLKKRNKEQSEEIFKLKTSAKTVAQQIKLYLLQQSKRKDQKQTEVVTKFFKCLLDNEDSEFPDDLMEAIEDRLCFIAQKSIQTRLLTKDACLQLMDLEGHKIFSQVFDLLHRLETGGKRYDRNSCLPSSGDIQKAQTIVDRYAQTCRNETWTVRGGFQQRRIHRV